MTWRTSAVAVCRSSDSRNSLSSRAFSMAMTAWGAKVFEKLDFPVVESAHLLPVDNYCPDYFAVPEHWHANEGSDAADLHKSSRILVGWVRSHIVPYVDLLVELFGLTHTQHRTRSDQWFALAKLGVGRWRIVLCHYPECVPLIKIQRSEVRLTKVGGIGQNRIE